MQTSLGSCRSAFHSPQVHSVIQVFGFVEHLSFVGTGLSAGNTEGNKAGALGKAQKQRL